MGWSMPFILRLLDLDLSRTQTFIPTLEAAVTFPLAAAAYPELSKSGAKYFRSIGQLYACFVQKPWYVTDMKNELLQQLKSLVFLKETPVENELSTAAILKMLSKHSCKSLIHIAKEILSKGGGKINIPGAGTYTIIISTKKGEGDCAAFININLKLITVFSGNGHPLDGLVHEMRHAQQHVILGERTWASLKRCTKDGSVGPLEDPLEIDASAAGLIVDESYASLINQPPTNENDLDKIENNGNKWDWALVAKVCLEQAKLISK